MFGPVAKAVPVPVLGLAEVTQAGHVYVGVAEGERQHGFLAAGADPPEQAKGFLVIGKAAGVLLKPEDVAEVLEGDGEAAELVVLGGGELAVGGGQGGGGPVPGPGEAGVLEAGGGRPVPRIGGEPDPVVGDDVPVVFAARQRPVGVRVDEVGGDVGDEAGPFPVPPGPLIQDVQALQAAEGVVPVLGGPGEGQGVVQVGFLGAERPGPGSPAPVASWRW